VSECLGSKVFGEQRCRRSIRIWRQNSGARQLFYTKYKKDKTPELDDFFL